MRKKFKITRAYLESLGITKITESGQVFKGDLELKQYAITTKHPKGKDKAYPVIVLYDPEVYKRQLKEGKPTTGQRLMVVSRVIWAWFKGETPSDEYDIIHINDDAFDNRLDNLAMALHATNIRMRLYNGANQYKNSTKGK